VPCSYRLNFILNQSFLKTFRLFLATRARGEGWPNRGRPYACFFLFRELPAFFSADSLINCTPRHTIVMYKAL